MPTFTTVVHDGVTLNVEAWSIDKVVHDLRDTLLVGAPRGAKSKVDHSLIENGDGTKFALATLTILNQRGTEIDKALVWGEQPEVPTKQYHANDASRFIRCHSCKGELFYGIGRDRFYNHHVCAGCGASAATLTETGACT